VILSNAFLALHYLEGPLSRTRQGAERAFRANCSLLPAHASNTGAQLRREVGLSGCYSNLAGQLEPLRDSVI
jgi:hypothetical protein